MKERILQLDFLKGVFILLMVTFHLSLIEHTYPVLREAVYTFHMSAFLIISGYLANIEKDGKTFGKGLLRLVVPYIIFEIVYVSMVFLLGKAMHTTNAISELSLQSLISRMALHPSGPYWYIHTLIICTTVYYLIYKVFRQKGMNALLLTGLTLYVLSLLIAGVGWANIIYFFIGIAIHRSGKSFMTIIPGSLLALIPLCILFASPDNYHRGALAGVAITVLVISFLLSAYTYFPAKVNRFLQYLGCNSLAIVVFSPIFTVVTKMAAPLFSFDQTAICFATFALVFVVGCCLFCAWACDKLRVSQFIFRKDKFYVPY